MTSTDDLIRSLGSAAGVQRNASFQATFAVTGTASLVCALLLVFSIIGIRQDFSAIAVGILLAFRLTYTGALVFGASVVALYAAMPAASATALFAFLPAVIFLARGVIFDTTAFPIMGQTNTAVAFCVSSILFLSLPAMTLMLVVMWKGAPTRPLFAGAVVGMLSASVGAMAYTLACENDCTAFVATCYTAASAIMALIGAVVAHRILRL